MQKFGSENIERHGMGAEKVDELFGLTRTGIETIDAKLDSNISVICRQSTIKVADKIRPET